MYNTLSSLPVSYKYLLERLLNNNVECWLVGSFLHHRILGFDHFSDIDIIVDRPVGPPITDKDLRKIVKEGTGGQITYNHMGGIKVGAGKTMDMWCGDPEHFIKTVPLNINHVAMNLRSEKLLCDVHFLNFIQTWEIELIDEEKDWRYTSSATLLEYLKKKVRGMKYCPELTMGKSLRTWLESHDVDVDELINSPDGPWVSSRVPTGDTGL